MLKHWRRCIAVGLVSGGIVLLASFVYLRWSTIQLHARAWWFIHTRDVTTVEPGPGRAPGESWSNFVGRYSPEAMYKFQAPGFFQLFADQTSSRVIFDHKELTYFTIRFSDSSTPEALLRSNGFEWIEGYRPAYLLTGR